MRVFEGANIVTFLDCDGFTIGEAGGAKRFQSTMVSPDYVAPEILLRANRNGPIGVEQDEYALAVMIFQMLNNGIHPFQGVIKDSNTNAPTNDDKAASGLYPHGITPNPHITHRPQSVHDTWLDETRFLLDRAFVAGNKRPTATEWKQHFDKVITQKLLVRCNARPNDAMHIRFRDKDCPACRRLQYRKAQPPLAPRAPAPPNVNPAPPPKSSGWDFGRFLACVMIIVIPILLGLGLLGRGETPTEEPPAPTPSTLTEEPLTEETPVLPEAPATAEAAPAPELQPTAPAEAFAPADGMAPAAPEAPAPAEAAPAAAPWLLAQEEESTGFTSVYVSDLRAGGWVAGYESQISADEAARRTCEGQTTWYGASTDNGTCKKLNGGQAPCVAVARSPTGVFGAALGDTASRAESDALSVCQKHAADGSECITIPGGVVCK